MKKLKCEDPSSTPPPVVPSMSANQDMFANDGSFLERFKKLQGLLRKYYLSFWASEICLDLLCQNYTENDMHVKRNTHSGLTN